MEEIEEITDLSFSVRKALAFFSLPEMLNPDEIFSEDRHKHIVAQRSIICHVLRKYRFGLQEIGRILGQDHSTVIHACQKWEDYKAIYPEYSKLAIGFYRPQIELAFKDLLEAKMKLRPVIKPADDIIESLEYAGCQVSHFAGNVWHASVNNRDFLVVIEELN